MPTKRPRSFAGAISEIYAGAAMVETPTPIQPKHLKKAKLRRSLASAEPMADTEYRMPIQKRVFFLPHLSVGKPPKSAPTTVPQSAMPMTTQP